MDTVMSRDGHFESARTIAIGRAICRLRRIESTPVNDNESQRQTFFSPSISLITMGSSWSDLRLTPENYDLELCVSDSEADVYLCPLKCLKNPDHVNFIPANQFELRHLPPEIRHETVLRWIMEEIFRTVKITVKQTSPGRPETDHLHKYVGTRMSRTATGRVWVQGPSDVVLPCPVHNCPYAKKIGSDHTVYGYLQIATNKHVIFDDFEATNSTIELFYDSKEDKRRGEVVKMFGTSVHYDIAGEDHSLISCVFHEEQLCHYFDIQEIFDTLRQIPDHVRSDMSNHCFVISHPHGLPKKITVGDVTHRLVPWSERSSLHRVLERLVGNFVTFPKAWVTRYTAPTCPGSSGAPVLVCMNGRFCFPIYHSGYDTDLGLGLSKSYFQ